MHFEQSYQTDSISAFKPFWLTWRLLGVLAWQNKDFTIIYDIFMNLFVYIWYNIHLAIGLFMLPTRGDFFKNFSMTITCIVCSMKHYCIRWKFKELNEIMVIIAKLDERILANEERKYYCKHSIKMAKFLAKIYFSAYMAANVFAVVSVLLDSERRLMYPAWFPFDWNSSWLHYSVAIGYQFIGITILILINFSSDAIAPVTLCLISGQVHVFSMRVAQLGYDAKKSVEQHETELKLCVKDHLKLLSLFTVTEDCFSLTQFILFISSGLNLCVALIYLFFFADNLYASLYYSFFICAIVVELFPIYYYGTILQEEFNSLPYAIFSSNWQVQTRSYHKSLLIFGEVTLRKLTMLGGGIVGIRLETFFAICKMAYSLFAVVIRLK